MGGYAGSPTYAAYVDMTLTRSKVKVKVTWLLNFRQLAKPCMLAAMTAAPLRGFLVLSACSLFLQIFAVHIIYQPEISRSPISAVDRGRKCGGDKQRAALLPR